MDLWKGTGHASIRRGLHATDQTSRKHGHLFPHLTRREWAPGDENGAKGPSGSPPTRPPGVRRRESTNATLGGMWAGVLQHDPWTDKGRGSSDATPRGTQAGGPPTRLPDRRVGRRQESSDTTPGWTQKQGAPTPGRHWESEWHSLPPGASPVKKAVSHPRKRKRRRAHESTADAAARSTGRLARCEAQYQGHFSSSQTAQVSKGSKFQDSETLVFTTYNVQMLTSNFVLFTYIHTSIPGKTMVTHKIN